MMFDIIMCITFFILQNKYRFTRFICQNLDKKPRYIDNQKVQVADVIERDVCKYLV